MNGVYRLAKNGVWVMEDAKILPTKLVKKVPTRNDKIFFDAIKKLNAEKKQGASIIIQVSENEAMLIYWGKHGWQREILPFGVSTEMR